MKMLFRVLRVYLFLFILPVTVSNAQSHDSMGTGQGVFPGQGDTLCFHAGDVPGNDEGRYGPDTCTFLWLFPGEQRRCRQSSQGDAFRAHAAFPPGVVHVGGRPTPWAAQGV